MSAAVDVSYVNKIDCEVVDYQLANSDPSYYNNHIFMIKVWIQKHMYAIDRSYAAFCDLDARLRKQYARSNIPPLKLAGASITTKLINSTNNLKESKKVLLFPPESESDRCDLKLLKRVESSEIISQKKKYLTGYLQSLLKIPEIVLSDILLYFLDEESLHGEHVTETLDEQSDSKEIGIVLRGLEMTTRMVRADRQQEVSVPPHHFVVWSFNTLNHDVGFSITYKDKEILKYQRYDSHQKLIMGHFEMPEAGTVKFTWDNSYSRWRSKTVNYVIKVVCPEEYEAARATATELKKDRLLFLKQRGMVKTALVALSSSILSSRGNIIAAAAIPSASTPLLSISTSSPSLVRATSVSAEEQLKRTSSAKEVNTTNTSTSSSAASSPTNTSNQPDTASVRATVPSNTSYWEFADMSEAMREVTRLRNEKKTLQQALGESETALVTERSIAAQYIAQCETCMQKNDALTEELSELKAEFDLFRENYFNEMESKLAETLATFEIQNTGSGGGIGKSTSSGDDRENRSRSLAAPSTDALTAAPNSQSLFDGFDVTAPHSAVAASDYDPPAHSPSDETNISPEADEVSFNQLINLTPAELSRLQVSVLVNYYDKLNQFTQTMLKRGYLTKDMEQTLSKLKNEKKQLKAYAIQMKTSLDSLSLRYIHLDQDRAELLSQVRELKDLVVLLETDRRGLREHISQLAGETEHRSRESSGGGEGEVGGERQGRKNAATDSIAALAMTQSNSSAGSSESAQNKTASDTKTTPPQPKSSWININSSSNASNNTSNTNAAQANAAKASGASESDSSFSISMWLNSGLASASAAMSFEGFDFGESHYYGGSSSGAAGSGVRHSSGVLSQQNAPTTSLDVSTVSHGESSYGNGGASSSTKIVISMEDLQQAAMQSTTTTQSTARNSEVRAGWDPETEDTGSDCGYSVCNDEENSAHSPRQRSADDTPLRTHSNTSHTSGTTHSRGENASPASASSDSGLPFTKVTEQLYGILPTWGQIQKLRNSSLI